MSFLLNLGKNKLSKPSQRSKIKDQIHNSKLKNRDIISNIINYFTPIYLYKIFGKSMYPVLRSEDRVLVNRLAYSFGSPKKGDIIAASDPLDGKTIIKRVIKIENNRYFVEGDNKKESTDSMNFGLIDKDNIIGKVIFVL